MKKLKQGERPRGIWIFVVYLLIILPVSLLVGLTVPFGRNGMSDDPILQIMALISWGIIIIPIALFIKNLIAKRRALSDIVNKIKNIDCFYPQPGNEYFHLGDGKYFGIDTSNGTMLYVHRLTKNKFNILSLNVKTWSSKEVKGNKLRINTVYPEFPFIEITAPFAQRWFDILESMCSKSYSNSSLNNHIENVISEIKTKSNNCIFSPDY